MHPTSPSNHQTPKENTSQVCVHMLWYIPYKNGDIWGSDPTTNGSYDQKRMRPEKKHWLAVSSICMHIIIIIYYYYFVCSPPARWGSLDCNKGPSPSPLSSSPNHSCLPPSSGCGPRLDPNTCRRECQPKCQKECHNRCQAECQKECQNRCQIECQESMSDRISDYMPERMSEYTCYVYVIHTFRWYVRNYAGRNILQGGDDCCTIFGMLIPIDGCIFLRSWLNHV